MAILSPIVGPATVIWDSLSSQAWSSLVVLCKNGTLSQLQSIRLGKLALYESSAGKGSVVFGAEREGHPMAILHVHDEKFWVRLALFADMVRLRNTLGIREPNRSLRVSRKATCLEKLHRPI